MKTLFTLLAAALLGTSLPAGAEEEFPQPDPPAGPTVLIPGVVARAQFTREIRNLEPIDAVFTLTNDVTRIAYFTEIHDMAGQTVVHRWEYDGRIILEVPIEVGSDRWRAYSTKTLPPSWTGEWKVSVVDAEGHTLSVNTFSFLPSPGPSGDLATRPPP